MFERAFQSFCFALSVLGCWHGPPIETSKQAIALGIAACDRDWGVRYSRIGINLKVLIWKARFYNGDRWDVWVVGTHGSKPGKLEVIVPKSGDAPSACAIYGNFIG